MTLPVDLHSHIFYVLKRDVTKLYIAIAIRNFALGMVVVFEAIYLYKFFGFSIPLTLLFYAVMHGTYALLAPFGGMLLSKLGTARSVLISSVFYVAYYIFLGMFETSSLFVPAAILSMALGMMFFWTAFQVDFARFTSSNGRGKEVGKMNVISLLPLIVAPMVGGIILSLFGYTVLFTVVLMILISSSIPLFYSKENYEVYSDSYKKAWSRILRKRNIYSDIALTANGIELLAFYVFWPIFLYTTTIAFSSIGGIMSLALLFSSLFMVYVGRISDTGDRSWLLNIGSFWMALSWTFKYFVTMPLDALLAHIIYRTSRAATNVPFQTYYYETAVNRKDESDEFLVYREIVVNLGRLVFFSLAALAFFLIPQMPIQAMFLVLAVMSLGFMFLGRPVKIIKEIKALLR